MTDTAYPRDLVGYGRNPPDPRWPGEARKAEILAAFERRLNNDRDTELATALAQVERIALLRLQDRLP